MSQSGPTRVLFVCHANVCRSPLAEGLFRHLVAERGMAGKFRVDGAGVQAMEGAPPSRYCVEIGQREGFEVGGASRQIHRDDLEQCDHILLMDLSNLERLEFLARTHGGIGGFPARVRLLLEASGEPPGRQEVADPIGGPREGYETMYRQVRRACEHLLDQMVAEGARQDES